MAFNFFLRRASASIVPLGIRSAGGVIPCFRRQFLPISRFSSAAIEDIVRIMESDNSAQQSSNMMIHIPDDFPFEIEENKDYLIEDQKRYIFRRKCQDEIIEVSADGYEVRDDKPSIPMQACVLCGSRQLRFEMTAEPNQIHIHTCTMEDTTTGHLKAFQNYLEIRGFNSSTMNYLFNRIWKQIPNDHIVRVIYNGQQSPHVPDGFPFEIKEGYGDDLLILQRHFEDEMIEAKVELPYDSELACARSVVYCERAFRITVEIVHRDLHTNFLIDVIPQHPHRLRIHIHEMCMRYSKYCENTLACERDESGHLEAFQNFLEIRGIKPSTTNFLFDYFKKKDEKCGTRSNRRWNSSNTI